MRRPRTSRRTGRRRRTPQTVTSSRSRRAGWLVAQACLFLWAGIIVSAHADPERARPESARPPDDVDRVAAVQRLARQVLTPRTPRSSIPGAAQHGRAVRSELEALRGAVAAVLESPSSERVRDLLVRRDAADKAFAKFLGKPEKKTRRGRDESRFARKIEALFDEVDAFAADPIGQGARGATARQAISDALEQSPRGQGRVITLQPLPALAPPNGG